MGHGMATSALREGITTIVWNRNPAATRDLADLGAEVAETATDAARRAAMVVTIVRAAAVGSADLTNGLVRAPVRVRAACVLVLLTRSRKLSGLGRARRLGTANN